MTATGDPAPRITKTGRLPSGVRFTANGDGTAAISGTPAKAAAGVYPLTLTAKNKTGTGVHPDRDQGPVAYLEQLVGELMNSLAAARPTAGKDAGIELEAG